MIFGFFNVLLFVVLATGMPELNRWLLLLLSIGIWVVPKTYFLLTIMFNRRRIMVQKDGIVVQHTGLIPSLSRKRFIDRYVIKQVYCKRRSYKDGDGRIHYLFDVCYQGKDTSGKAFIKGLQTHDEALFIEQQIERLYNIADTLVVDEWDKDPKDPSSKYQQHIVSGWMERKNEENSQPNH